MAGNNARVILHIDLDCFYCQVEQKRLNIPRETPCAVQQWEGLIAVNYAARAAGITRHMRVHEARQKCPDLRTVHVQTLGGDGSEEAANDAGNVVTDRSQQKACLERYRKACSEILAVFHDVAPQVVIEKASIDEVYMDVTTLVDEELQESGAGRQEGDQGHAGGDALQVFSWGSVVVGCPLDVDSEFDRRLAVGAKIACRLRGAIRDRLGFTCSAGIACNKLLAKIASAMHKPNQQTLVPPRAVPGLMQDLPLKKIRNFGGKLGAELDAMGCRTAGDVIALPHQQLRQRFGEEKAGWIAGAVRGESNEPVQVKEKPKSMLAAKSFEPTSDLAILTRWLRILADELANRMIDDEAQHQRRPRNLCLHYRSGSVERSKSTQMPRFGKAGPTTEVLTDAAVSLFRKLQPSSIIMSRSSRK
ncbi:hypothetical protein WJX72_005200 [[Myrmecia] bisecta]|uniref:DNA polymerase eta n=1 Tax=[Myrmecia] bisecta TaxID=41462 RepID=A0AAW1R7D0_9CHLO